jgi:ubiquitin-conjugating enzyme E2 Q
MLLYSFADVSSDVSDYPSEHTYFLFTTSENVPSVVTAAIEKAQSSVSGHNIFRMLSEVSTAINHAISGTGQPDDDTESENAAEEEDLLSEDDSDADMWSNNSTGLETQVKTPAQPIHGRSLANKDVKSRIRSDLRLAKEAGFKVGVLGNLDLGGIVCVSVRLAKLGISEEAMNAWGIQRNQYLILLIRYGNGYKNIEDVKEENISAHSKTEFRVALCRQYKPSITEAVDAFNQLAEKSKGSNVFTEGQTSSKIAAEGRVGVLEPLFIGRPLNDVLTRLPAITKYRLSCSFSWTGAELFFNEIQVKAAASIDVTNEVFNVGDCPASQVLPKLVTADHIGETFVPREMSFPLAGMQFLLRHFVRCTEFCLVCHCKIDMDFEALKPYVCSKPLCLFQYMALGFGPSIEWEILSQPYVVDLLVSFCYASAQGHRLKDFPIGIDLKVPVLPRPAESVGYYRYPRVQVPLPTSAAGAASALSVANALIPPSTPTGSVSPRPYPAKFDTKTRELLLVDQTAPGPVRIGEWVVVTAKCVEGSYHARVEEKFFPTIRLGELVHVSGIDPKPSGNETSKVSTTVGFIDAEVYVYDQNFDGLSDQEKRSCIMLILDTLPDVMQMKAFLENHAQDPSLKRFRHRISESALNLLRWIIASNRSCIMQVDRTSSSSSFAGIEDRVSGMDDWMQFRFAQGAPDKEQRFMDRVKEVSTRLGLKEYPTLFAWHGSPLANWHSIVREGLHFNDTLHGRAFGHGVYMSPHASTSIGYSNIYSTSHFTSNSAVSTNWRNSKLCISGALTLNEVVNAPDQYVTKTPHYVVNQIDWIQARYLFVKGNHLGLGHNLGTSTTPKFSYQQDPKHTALNERHQPIIIPITAISKSRRPTTVTSPVSIGRKKVKVTGSVSQEQAEKTIDDAASMITNSSDLNLLLSDDDDEAMEKSANENKTAKRNEAPKTDFIPDQLDASTLPLLAAPTNASTSATKALLSTLKQTLHTQKTTPLHELGWYIPESLITNIYQWIVELHTFDPTLPLAHDMKKAGLKSIILEIRFSNNFPISPPFVRVIRPRFVPFTQGGGGHVTGGGALCMELLTNSGWSPVSSVESVLLQVRMAMSNLDPKPARLVEMTGRYAGKKGVAAAGNAGMGGFGSRPGGPDEYSVGEAVAAYKRACALHGWDVPKEFDDFLKG